MKCKNCGEAISLYGPETFHTESTMIKCEVLGFKAEPYMEIGSNEQMSNGSSDELDIMQKAGFAIPGGIKWGPRKPFESPVGSSNRTIFVD